MLDVIGLGENSIDLLCAVPHLPGATAAKIPILRRTTRPGGQVATTMAACASLGLRAGYIGSFGTDDGGEQVRRALTGRGVDVRHAIIKDAESRAALILVDANGERVVLWQRDPRLVIQPGDVRGDWVADVRAVHVDAVDEDASIELARLARRAGLPVTCDVDTVTARTPELLDLATVPILGEAVAMALTGAPTNERALWALRTRHAGMLVVTLGSRGAMMLEGDDLLEEPAFKVPATDTTGAGDIFRAGFIYAMLNGLRRSELLRFANATAAVSCTRPGAIDSVPTLDEVRRLLATRATKPRHEAHEDY